MGINPTWLTLWQDLLTESPQLTPATNPSTASRETKYTMCSDFQSPNLTLWRRPSSHIAALRPLKSRAWQGPAAYGLARAKPSQVLPVSTQAVGSRGWAGCRSLPGAGNNHGKGSWGMEWEQNKCFWTGTAAQAHHQASLGIAGRGDAVLATSASRIGQGATVGRAWLSKGSPAELGSWPQAHTELGISAGLGKKNPARDTGQSRP